MIKNASFTKTMKGTSKVSFEVNCLFCFRLDMVQIRGKRGRAVPLLLTKDVKQAISVLQEQREASGVLAENPYVFARPRNSKRPIRGWDCLKAVATRANLKEPGAITSTKLRKYVATVSQIIDLSNNELDWLARHLGHDINVTGISIASMSPQLSWLRLASSWLLSIKERCQNCLVESLMTSH